MHLAWVALAQAGDSRRYLYCTIYTYISVHTQSGLYFYLHVHVCIVCICMHACMQTCMYERVEACNDACISVNTYTSSAC